jgi:GH18 family chitinase
MAAVVPSSAADSLSHSSPNYGMIFGCIAAGMVIAGAVLVIVYFFVLKKNKSAAPATPGDTPKSIVAGYAPLYAGFRQGNGYFAAFKVNPKLYTHLLVAFANVNSDGTITLDDMKPLDDTDPNSPREASIANIMRQYTALRDGCNKSALNTNIPQTTPPTTCDKNECDQIYKNFSSNLLSPGGNKDLKIMISIGGWNASGPKPELDGYSAFHDILVDTNGKMATFIKSCVDFVKTYNLDGVDLDIECPGAPQNNLLDDDELKAEKEGFTVLIQKLGAAMHAEGKLISFAAMVGGVIDKVYEWKKLSEAADFINLMTYDFHGSPYDDVTGANTPLMADHDPQSTFNINYVLQYITDLGVKPEKLILGLASYGRTFPQPAGGDTAVAPYGQSYKQIQVDANVCMQDTIKGAYPGAIIQTKDWDITQFNAFKALTDPVKDLHAEVGVECGVGLFTLNQGSLAFYEIMDLIQDKHQTGGGSAYQIDATTNTAYAYITSGGSTGPEWGPDDTQFEQATVLVSFDTFETVGAKCKLALDKKLGGVMIWSIGEDDMYNNFPFSAFVRNYMDSRGKMTTTPEAQQAAYLSTRTKTPVTCSDKCYTDSVCVGDNWSTPGMLTGIQQIGQQNCGCTWDWPRFAHLTTRTNDKCSDVCDVVRPFNQCWLNPDDSIKIDGNATDTCQAYYSTHYPPKSSDDEPLPSSDDPKPATMLNYCAKKFDWNNTEAIKAICANATRCADTDEPCDVGETCYQIDYCLKK